MIEHNNFLKALYMEIHELSDLASKLEENLEMAPEGSLHILQKQGKTPEYYHYLSRKKRTYISKKNLELATDLAQKEYNQNLLSEVKRKMEYALILEEQYKLPLKNVYEEMPETKRNLVTAFELDDEEFVKKWKEKNPKNMNPFPISTNIFSNQGVQMRSKSEKIIADLFDRYGVPYIYEPRIILQNGRTVYPDFLVLNIRLRKIFLYEHFGLMSDGQYAEKTSEKISMYVLNDYFVGDNFLFSMESQSAPLNTKIIEKIIKTYLK